MSTAQFHIYHKTSANGKLTIATADTTIAARKKLDEICRTRKLDFQEIDTISIIPKRDDQGFRVPDVLEVCDSNVEYYKHTNYSNCLRVKSTEVIIEEFGITVDGHNADVATVTERKTAVVAAVAIDTGTNTGKREKVITGEEYVKLVQNYFSERKTTGASSSANSAPEQLKQLQVYRLDSLWSLSQKELSQLYYWLLSRIGDKFPLDYAIHLELLNYLGNLLGRSALKNIVSGNRYLETAKLMGYSVPASSCLPEWVDQLATAPYEHLVTCTLLDEYEIPSDYDLKEKLLEKIAADMCVKFNCEAKDKVKLIQHVYDCNDERECIPFELGLLVSRWIHDFKDKEAETLIPWAQEKVKKFTQLAANEGDKKLTQFVANEKDDCSSCSSCASTASTVKNTNLPIVNGQLAKYFNLLGNLYANIDEEHLKNLHYFKAATMGNVNGISNLHNQITRFHWLPLLAAKVDYFTLPI